MKVCEKPARIQTVAVWGEKSLRMKFPFERKLTFVSKDLSLLPPPPPPCAFTFIFHGSALASHAFELRRSEREERA